MHDLPDMIEIYIITYNRADQLIETVNALLASPFSRCTITILDNCSTDGTAVQLQPIVAGNPQVRHVRNVTNIGAGANAIQPFLMSRAPYTWVICDDDYLDFSQVDDVMSALRSGTDKLLIVGGHAESVRLGGGLHADPRSLVEKGLNYFRDTSFSAEHDLFDDVCTRLSRGMLCFLRSALSPCCDSAGGPIARKCRATVSKARLVTPSIGTQSYSQTAQMRWWFGLAKTIHERSVRRQFLASQFVGLLDRTGQYGLINTLLRMRLYGKAVATLLLFNVRMIGAVGRMIGARARGVRYR
ncbi:MAG: glycosyltransferase [Sphingomonas taxi]